MSNGLDHPFYNPKIISICTGMGGLERGLERAIGPIDVVAYVEREAFLCANLIQRMDEGVLGPAPVWDDVTTFDGTPFRDKIHGIVGGYPCQGESTAGLMLGEKDPRFIYWHIERLIGATRPFFCLFENVRNHLNQSFPIVLESLQKMGYQVEVGIYSAEEVGAPHQRDRVFILAIKMEHPNHSSEQHASGDSTKKLRQHSHAGSSLGDTQIEGLEKRRSQRRNLSEKQQTSQRTSGKMADTHLPATNGLDREISGETSQAQRKEQGPNGQRMRNESGYGSEPELAYSHHQRSNKLPTEERQSVRYESGIYGGPGRAGQWPAGQGIYQHDWEATRTIESGLGATAHGYNFREDLLRMAGNAVVEQQAAFAVTDLLRKHGITLPWRTNQ